MGYMRAMAKMLEGLLSGGTVGSTRLHSRCRALGCVVCLPPPSSSVPFLTWLAVAAAQGRGETYVVGIVDVLQEFTCLKAAECAAKQILAGLRGGHPNCMSIVPPSAYASRLRHYISQNTE